MAAPVALAPMLRPKVSAVMMTNASIIGSVPSLS